MVKKRKNRTSPSSKNSEDECVELPETKESDDDSGKEIKLTIDSPTKSSDSVFPQEAKNRPIFGLPNVCLRHIFSFFSKPSEFSKIWSVCKV